MSRQGREHQRNAPISIASAGPLYAAQLVNYLSPILILPVLARNLGVVPFGLLVFYQAVAAYVLVVSEYGYAFTGPRDVARSPGSLRRAYLLSTITVSKFYLALSAGALAGLLTWLLDSSYLALALVCLIQPLSQAAFPGWYLQGRERFLVLAVCLASGRLTALMAALFLVRDSSDLLVAALATSLAPALSAVTAWLYIARREPTSLHYPTRQAILVSLRRGRHMFQANLAGSLYLNTTVLTVGWLTGPAVVGAYGLAVRLISASSTLVSPISQIALPRVAALASSDDIGPVALAIRRPAIAIVAVGAICAMATFAFADQITQLIGGEDFVLAARFLTVLGLMPLVLATSIVVAHIVMIGMGWFSALKQIYWGMATLSILLTPIGVYYLGGEGAAWVWLSVEITGVALMVHAIWKRSPDFLRTLVMK